MDATASAIQGRVKDMSMISELIKELREYNHMLCDMGFPYDGDADLIAIAADTIEELSAKLAAANMERSTDFYNGGWVPVMESLPEEDGWYWVTEDKLYSGVTPLACFNAETGKFSRPFNYSEVVAWMPSNMPEPYKGE